MNQLEVSRLWNENAEAWTALARQGYDVYRDWVNTPAFLTLMPDVAGCKGLDLGCGDGTNTRQLAEIGAEMTGVDIAERFIHHAQAEESRNPQGITYCLASATALPFSAATFDFVTAFMSLMDMAESEKAIHEAYRVLKSGGFLQFSITHPCFDTPFRQSLKDSEGKEYAIAVGGYFETTNGQISEWIFSNVPDPQKQQWPKFRIPRFHRTLSEWLNQLIASGFVIEAVAEPKADDEIAAQCPTVADTQIVAYFLHIRCRKPQA